MPKRSYFEEIEELKITWEKLVSINPIISTKVTPQLLKGTAYCIGSGGSLALAKLWQYVHESNNLGHAKAMTPFEYNYSYLASDLVILFSASGKNHDILQVFKTALKRGSKVLVFTVSPNSALIRLVRSNPLNAFAIFPAVDTPKDGFLAVNSVISMAFLIRQLQAHLFGGDNLNQSPVSEAFIDHYSEISRINLSPSISTLQIVTSDWGVPASLDLEARSAESGIVSCYVTDPRNFGHGRFIWLDIHKEDMVVLITTPKTYPFYNRLRNLLPDYVTCYNIKAPAEGPWGAIYCITRSILIFGELSKTRSIDPGKPEVPEWGRKIHRLQLGAKDLAYPKNNITNTKKAEYPALRLNFSGIVMDIDGTLIDTRDRFGSMRKEIGEELNRLIHLGVKFGFSTGRGKSAVKILKEHIPEQFWSQILVGLYNGTQLIYLSDDINSNFLHEWPIHKLIALVTNDIFNDYKKLEVDYRPTQVSITGLTKDQGDIIGTRIINRLGQHARFIKILASGHSIDILPHWASKLSVVEAINVGLDDYVLCIGDQGQVGGNDEELLSWRPSVSVGSKRPASNDCLWLGFHAHLRETAGTLKLLRAIEKRGHNFYIDSEKIFN